MTEMDKLKMKDMLIPLAEFLDRSHLTYKQKMELTVIVEHIQTATLELVYKTLREVVDKND